MHTHTYTYTRHRDKGPFSSLVTAAIRRAFLAWFPTGSCTILRHKTSTFKKYDMESFKKYDMESFKKYDMEA